MDRLLRPSRLMRPVELAHCQPFRIGPAEVRPATREVVFGGRRETLEPRVMQVLVALAAATGEILSRSDLNDLCWDGLAVSDHAMNRVISRLRALARETCAFEIETITKVGYRLKPNEPESADATEVLSPANLLPSRGSSRRALLVGGGVVAAAGAALVWRTVGDAGHNREVEALLDHAWDALRRDREDETATAISNLRLAIEKDPRSARAWGLLALAYSWTAQLAPPSEARAAAERTQDAIDRALELDSRSEFALAARVWQKPLFGHWLETDRAVRAALDRRPRSPLLLNRLTDLLLQTGRWRDALPVSASLQARDLFSPSCWALRTMTLHDNGRAEEAAQASNQALRLYPRHPVVWFNNLNFLADAGQFVAAQAFLEDRAGRPLGLPDEAWGLNEVVIRALETREPSEVERALAALKQAVPARRYPMSRATVFMASVGRINDAYQALDSYYFGAGLLPAQRNTHVLFRPTTAALRGDPRFRPLTARLGLEAYWNAIGVARPA